MKAAPSTKRQCLLVAGKDAEHFLNGLLTIKLHKTSPARYGLLLTPQGKYLHDYFLLPHHDGWVMETASHRLEQLEKRLMLYRLRADVQISRMPWLVSLCAEASDTAEISFADPRHPELGWRCYHKQSAIPQDAAAYHHKRLALGIPEGDSDFFPEQALPIEFRLDRLGAIDFDKGCYVGQEVTARSKHRAKLHKLLYKVTSKSPLPAFGSPLLYQHQKAGNMLSSDGTVGLAMLSIEKAEAAIASAQPLLAEGCDTPIHPEITEWMKN